MAKVVQNVHDYFETEKARGQRDDIGKVVERTKNATGVSMQKIVAIGKCKDLDMWAFEDDEEETREREMKVPTRYVAVVRQALRFFFLEKRQMPTVKTLHDELKLDAARRESEHSGVRASLDGYGERPLYSAL
jgi:hypothetical protein